MILLPVALGGGLGSVARFLVAGVVERRLGVAFPWGTLVVNVSGSAAIGALAAIMLAPGGQMPGQGSVWAGLVIGVLGSYTTVSSFSLQTLALARVGALGRALGNVVLSLLLCLVAAGGAWLVVGSMLGSGGGP